MNRPLPSNPEAESALLGAILINNDAFARVAPFLEAEHFFEPVHGRIYAFMASLIQQGRVASPVTMKTFLPADMAIGDFTPLEYLAHLCADATTIANAEDYGRVVRDMAAKRALIEVAEDVLNLAYDGPVEMTASKILDDTEDRLGALREGHKLSAMMSLRAHVESSVSAISDAYRNHAPPGWNWPIPEMEQVVDGPLEQGNLYGLLGASGDGKTSATAQTLWNLAEKGVPALFLSGEQTVRRCLWQMHAQRLGISASNIRTGKITEGEFTRIMDDGQKLGKMPLMIEQWSDMKVGALGMRIRAFVKRYGPGVFAVDHVKKITPDHPNDILAQQVFQVYEGLKNVAMQTGCAGLILMQRNSEFLNRPVARPVRRDVYGGEGGLQNLDGCLAAFRPEVWLREKMNLVEKQSEQDSIAIRLEAAAGRAEFYSLKTRYGEMGREKVARFEAPYTRFVSLPKQRAEEAPEMEF